MPERRSVSRARKVSALALTVAALSTGGPTAHHGHSGPAAAAAPVGLQATDEGVRVARREGVTVSAPGQVPDGARIRVRGHVPVAKGGAARAVTLQEQRDHRWVVVRRARADRYGRFAVKADGVRGPVVRTFRVAAGGPGLRPVTSAPFVVQVGAGQGGGAAVGAGVDAPGPMEVPAGDWDPAEYPRPGTPAAGDPSDWTWLWSGGARWNPCQVITWAYNPAGSYAGSLQDAQRAFARVAGRTGLHFKYVGPTGLLYLGDGALAPGPDIVVAWSDATGVAALAGGIVGLGGGWALPVGADVANQIVSGYVVLDRDAQLTGGFTLGGMPTWGQVMEHEIGHAVGLGHAHGAQQVMYASVGSDDHQFGAGDLAGLARAGAAAGCL